MSAGGVTFASGALLALAPLGLGLALWLCRGAGGAAPAEPPPHVALRLLGSRGLAAPRARTRRSPRGLCLGLGTALALAALARPQWGQLERVTREPAREVLIALDLSRSMTGEDVAPSRLARAKLLLESLLGELRGERVGLVVFAGTAFVQSPLSADSEVLRELLPGLEPESLPQGGTDYAALLRACLAAFDPAGEADRFLVVLSDGEAHGEAWRAWLPRLRERGVRVLALGIGTPAGAVLRDAGGALLKDARGAAVLSRLEPERLRALAEATDGRYADAAVWVDLPELLATTVARGRTGAFLEERELLRQERFQWLLAPALALLLLSAWRELPVVPRPRRIARGGAAPPRGARVRRAAALPLLLALGPSLAPEPAPAAGPAEPSPLAALVGELAREPALGASDFARLAEATLEAAEPPGGLAPEVREGVLGDALAAVAEGVRLDPAAADWPELRRRLEELLRREPPPADSAAPQEPAQPEEGQEPRAGSPGPASDAQPGEGREGPGEAAAGGAGEPPQAAGEGGPRDPEATGPQGADALGALDEPTSGPGSPEASAEPAEPPEAASGGADENAGADAAEPAAAGATRLVGGGSSNPEAAEHPELAEILGRLQQVRDRDSPGRLFEAMRRAEGEPRPEPGEPAW